jgi:ABC-type nitrate/sulfonate/bicarbonate transport system substrate-binding protein
MHQDKAFLMNFSAGFLLLSSVGIAHAQSAEPTLIRQTVVTAVTNLPALLAPNYASQFGLKIEIVPARTPQEAVTAVLRGDVDLFTGVPTQVIQARDVGLPLVIISGSVRASTQLLLKKTLNIKPDDWAALRALVSSSKASGAKLRFGTPVAGSTNYATCYASLLKNGIDPKVDLDIVPMQDFPSHGSALGKGDISMLCTSEPFATIASQNGTGSFFVNPYDSELGDQLGSINTSEKVLQDPRKREALQRYVRLFDFVVQKIKADPTVARNDIMKRFGMTAAAADRTLEHTYWDMRLDVKEIAALAKFTYAPLGQTKKDWSCCVKDYVDTSFTTFLTKR